MFDNIKRLIKWIPIIWKDRDYDQWFLLEIMYTKLDQMYEFWISDNTHTVGSEKTAKQILTAKELIKRLKEDKYGEYYWTKHYKKYGSFKMIENDNGNYQMVMEKENFSNTLEIKNNLKLMHEYENYMYKQDMELFCKILQKHIRTWWD